MQCEFAQHLEKGTNSKRIKYFGRSENLIAESPVRERVLAFAAYYWSVLDEHPPSACRDVKRARGAL
jgi:hypothetical protein